MPRDYKTYLDDILEAINYIRDFTTGYTLETLSSDIKTQHAVIRNLEVIGEAVTRLTDDFRAAHPEAEWRKIAGLRNILIHEYFGIDLEIIWDIITHKLPVLAERIKQILSE